MSSTLLASVRVDGPQYSSHFSKINIIWYVTFVFPRLRVSVFQRVCSNVHRTQSCLIELHTYTIDLNDAYDGKQLEKSNVRTDKVVKRRVFCVYEELLKKQQNTDARPMALIGSLTLQKKKNRKVISVMITRMRVCV